MTRSTITIATAVVALALSFGAAVAQPVDRSTSARSGRIGISFQAVGIAGDTIIVTDVLEGGPAAQAGIEIGDRIVRWNGRTDVVTAVESAALRIGDTVRVRVGTPGRVDRDLDLVAVDIPYQMTARRPSFADAFVPNAELLVSRAQGIRIDVDSLETAIDSLNARLRIMVLDSVLLRTHALRATVVADSLIPEMAARVARLNMERGFATAAGDSVRDALEAELRRARGYLSDTNRSRTRGTPSLALAVAGGRSAVAGAELADLTDGLGDYFGTDAGVLVLRVAADTPAARAGLEDGDVIVTVGDEAIASVADLRQALSRPGTGSFSLGIVRRGERRTLMLGR